MNVSTRETTTVPRPSILLVDDDPFALGLQHRMLQGLGYLDVAMAASGRAALAHLEGSTPAAEVVICDLNMPDMDGVEFLQALDSSPFDGSVIVLSAEDARIIHTVRKLLGGGRLTVLGALEKPASPAALKALLDGWAALATSRPPQTAPLIEAADIRDAGRNNEWRLHYQPKVCLSTGEVKGVEALVRWAHPRHGLVYPGSFIELAESIGAIDALTDWVFLEAMRQHRLWQAQHMSIPVAINVSMDSLGTPDFARRIMGLVRDAGMSPQDLTLEITESRAMSPSPAPLENLVRFRLQRFSLSIDDFGTGHSSLAQLRDLPFTELKIDRSFVHGARSNQIIRPILEGSIGIAKRLGLTSVAEGVETESDFQLLREIECDVAQGYFFARPMSGEQVPAWMAIWSERSGALFNP